MSCIEPGCADLVEQMSVLAVKRMKWRAENLARRLHVVNKEDFIYGALHEAYGLGCDDEARHFELHRRLELIRLDAMDEESDDAG